MAGLSIIISAVDDFSNKLEKMESAGERAMNAFDQLGAVADGSFTNITEAMERALQATDYWTDAVGNYERQSLEAMHTTEEFVDMGSETEVALNNIANAVEEAASEIDRFGEESEAAGEDAEQFGDQSTDAVSSLSNIIAAAGIAVALEKIGEMFSECSVAAAEFELSVAKVTTVADGMVLSADELATQMSGLSTDMAKDVNEIADSAYNAISAGIDTAKAVDTVGTATELSVAGFTGVSSSLSVLTTALNAYKLENDELTNVSDSLVMSQNLGVLTIDQLSSSIGKAISTASAYSVDLYNLESGYISLTKAGIGVDEATTYISSMFNELGDSGSAVAQVIKDETGKSFGELMSVGSSLGDVLSIVYDSVNQNSEALMNLWGSAEAGKASNAVISQGLENFNNNLNLVKKSTGATERAYNTMTATAEFATERMANSFANMDIAIGEDLNPSVAALKNGVADVVDMFTELIKEHPAITGVLTGVTIAVTAVTTAIIGYKAATVVATLATAAWTAVMDMNPVFLAVTAVAALTAGIVGFAAVLENTQSETDMLTEASRRQFIELENLTSEYDNTCDKFGETSEQALRLKFEVDELSSSYAANKETIEEFATACDIMVEAHEKLTSEYENNIASVHENEIGTMALIQRLSDLSSSTTQTVGAQAEMEAIISELNESVDGLSLSFYDLMNNQDFAIDSMKKMAAAQAEQEAYQEQYEMYVDSLKEEAVLKEQLEEANYNASEALERYNTAEQAYLDKMELLSTYDTSGTSGMSMMFSEEQKELSNASEALETYTSKQEELQGAYDESISKQKEIESLWDETGQSADDAMNEQISASDAFLTAVSGVQEEINGLATSYDDAFNAARESIDGQIGLFETMKTASEQSVSDMQAAMESQIEYLNTYTENLQKASEYGLDDSLVTALSDGSMESAGQLDAIISKVEELGGTTEGLSQGAQAFVDSFNGSFAQVDEAKNTFTGAVIEMEKNFAASMDAMENELTYAIDKMNMSSEAASAANTTMDAYINAIKTKTGEANAAFAALNYANQQFSVPGVTGIPTPAAAHAEGGIFDTPHYGVFAEAGPEAFIPIDGSQNAIDIWEDVGHMMGALPESEDSSQNTGLYLAESTGGRGDLDISGGDSSEKKVLIEIAGSGSIKVGSADELRQQGDSLTTRVHDIIVSILQEEIFTEGDGSYEY